MKITAQKKNAYPMPPGIDAATAEWLQKDVMKLGPYRDETLTGTTELRHLRWFYQSAPECRSETFYPRLEGMTPKKWRRLRRLIPIINLLRPVVTTFVSAVYNGTTTRTLVKSPAKDRLQAFVNSPEYQSSVTQWAANAITYGVALAIPQVGDDGELSIYLPDPCGTYIWTDPLDVRKITKVIEITECSIRYFTLSGYGILTRDNQVHVPCDYGEYLPVAYAAGEDLRCQGRIYGCSLGRDALSWSVAVGDCYFKARMLQAKETASKFVISGVDDMDATTEPDQQTEQQTEPSEDPDTIRLPAGATAEFKSPDGQKHIDASINLARAFIGALATATGIPADSLDANYSMTGSGGSAEAARIRAIPLQNRSKFLCAQWAQYESDLILALTAQIEYAVAKSPIKLSDLKARVQTQISYDPNILPQSPNEIATTVIALLGAGIISAEEAVRRVTMNMTPEQIKQQAEEVKKLHEMQGGAAAVADNVFKRSATQQAASAPPARSQQLAA